MPHAEWIAVLFLMFTTTVVMTKNRADPNWNDAAYPSYLILPPLRHDGVRRRVMFVGKIGTIVKGGTIPTLSVGLLFANRSLYFSASVSLLKLSTLCYAHAAPRQP